ncbi:sulfate transporter family-domain-containing protein [Phascolomyces articulosus]|uniref:Sulfate transporter family-domain-containing protein n=1 Tax=Phascolomyces articulosus TaxID=60185 RepID=A0AAD5KAJ1_9FUNG|nr:sulfate transporter family-domain-containing protein [Phascolomyces articulosus]
MSSIFVDNPPSTYTEQVRSTVRNLPKNAGSYFSTTLPIVSWLPSYNWIWLLNDLISGLTVGTIIVPQAIAYAQLAGFPPEFGLYSCFVGLVIYPFVGTSKDINIGTTAISALFLSQVLTSVQSTPQYQSGVWTDQQFAVTMAFLSGIITLALSFFRLGFLFDFISQPALGGIMTGSAVTIVISQLGKILGVHVSTRDSPFMILVNILKNIRHTSYDAVFGILSLVWLYGVQYAGEYFAKRYPNRARAINYFSVCRKAICLIFTTFLAWVLVHFSDYEQHSEHSFTIIGPVPAGFQNMAVPKFDTGLFAHVASNLPSMVVLLIVEQCAVAITLGKRSGYRIDVNQEILSLGITNVFGAFFSAYPATGSFCRSAVANVSGAKTPLYNIFVAVIVVLALYALTPVFQFISVASLAAVIAHAVTELIVMPKFWRRFWNVHPSELFIFACAFFVAFFSRLDISIYITIGLTIIIQLYRTARPNYAFLGRLDNKTWMADQQQASHSSEKDDSRSEKLGLKRNDLIGDDDWIHNDTKNNCKYVSFTHPMLGQYIQPIAPGVVAFQPRESMVFENSLFFTQRLLDEIKRTTRRGKPLAEKVGDRFWNEVGRQTIADNDMSKPLLHAVIVDFTGFYQMDYTGIDRIKDAVLEAERYAGKPVSWYFVINDSLMVRKALLFGGFGTQERKRGGPFRSDLKKRQKEEGEHKGGILVPSRYCHNCGNNQQQYQQQQSSTNNKKAEEQQVVIEMINDVQNHTIIKTESALSCDNMYHHHDEQLLDVYPYFFFTMHEAVVASCTRHILPESQNTSSSSLTSSNNSPSNDVNVDHEEKKVEK